MIKNNIVETFKLYKDTIELKFDHKKHRYAIDGEAVDGVTTCLGIIAKPALLFWAVNKTIDHINDHWDLESPWDEVSKSSLLDEAKYAHRRRAREAADIGTVTHVWIDKFIKSKLA